MTAGQEMEREQAMAANGTNDGLLDVAVIGGSDQWPSIRLHEALGFRRAGLLSAVGFKFGGWIDCVLMQRALGSGATTTPDEIG